VLAAIAALVVVFEIYGPALNGSFVLDDLYLPFVANPAQSSLAVIRSLRPLLLLSFWADNRLAGGSDPFLFHATNVLFHFFAAVFATLIAAKLLEWAGVTGKLRAALSVFSGALFLLHPVQTESVAYVASRSENLSVMWYYAAFAVFLYRPNARMTWLRALAIVALFGAAMSTKEHALTFPILLLLTDYFWNRGGIRANGAVYALLAVAGVAGGFLVWGALHGADTAGFGVKGLPPATYFFTQCRVIWTYIRMFFLPFGQNLDPDVALSDNLLAHGAIVGLAALIALAAAAWIYRRRYPLAAFGVFMFLLLLAPTSSFIPIRDVQAEHRLYLPFLGLVLVCLEALRRLPFSQAVWTGAIVLAACCVLTYQRNEVWATSLDLWTDSVAKSPNKYRPRFQIAYAEYLDGKCGVASQNFEAASHLGRVDIVLLTDWALALDCAGRWQEAIEKLSQAELFVNDAHVHTQLAMVYAKHNQMPAALAELDQAQKLDASYEMIYVYRGNIDLIAGDRAGAQREFRRALTLNPANQAARDGLVQAAR
jgi:tetratricopeptide (TPR) repeat protein